MTKTPENAIVRAFQCETAEAFDNVPAVRIVAEIILEKGDIGGVDSGAIKNDLLASIKRNVAYSTNSMKCSPTRNV